jgi:putative redox protein
VALSERLPCAGGRPGAEFSHLKTELGGSPAGDVECTKLEDFPMTIQIRQISPSASEAAIHDHRVTIDRPVDKGGTDAGPMGGELFLAAVGGCFMSNFLAAAKARQAHVAGVQTEVIGIIDGTPPRFSQIELCVSADGLDRDLFEKLIEIAERGCIMVNTLRGKLDLKVRTAEHTRVS